MQRNCCTVSYKACCTHLLSKVSRHHIMTAHVTQHDMQVCLDSAKVRLNSGILERRHSNWGKALHHFRSARQIDDTYCELSYWIGATLLQEGKHLPQALQVCGMNA